MKKELMTYTKKMNELKFGDFILFQEYSPNQRHFYKVTKPILAIYLGFFIADQTVGFNYVRWINENKKLKTKFGFINQEVDHIHNHIEWSNYINILGIWKKKPNWKEIISSYRTQETKDVIMDSEINWDML